MNTGKSPSNRSSSLASPSPSRSSVNTVAAQDVKRRGVRAIIERLEGGPVHVLQHNRPAFVALPEQHYLDLLEEVEEARIRASLADVEAGRVRFASPSGLMKEFLD